MSSLFGIAANGASEFYPEKINQSLRFDGNAKLLRTPSSDGDRKKWTTSFWLKRAKIGVLQYLWSGASYSGNDGIAAIYINSDDKIHTYFDTSGSNPYGAVNDRVYRDTTNWYHIVWAVDAVNTVQRIWVNGVEETLASGNNPPNYAYGMNKAGTSQGFGVSTWGGSPSLQAYLANIVHLDGQYLDESYFGETKNGVWIPKAISGLTFGTNGFHLDFANSSSVGNDISGNNNDYTPTGFASTDVVPDSPTNNFCTFNPLYRKYNSSNVFSEGNLRYDVDSTGVSDEGFGTIALHHPSGGKWYAECRVGAGLGGTVWIGVLRDVPKADGGLYTATVRANGYAYRSGNGNKTTTNNDGVSYGASYTSGDIIGVALNLDDDEITFYKNNVSQGVAFSSIQALNQGTVDANGYFIFGVSIGSAGDDVTYNWGQDSSFAGTETAQGNTDANGKGDFYYAPPSGYLAVCSSNLPDTELSPNQLEQATDYFNVVLKSMSTNSEESIAVGFQPDWVWGKSRNVGYAWQVYDTNRGTTKYLEFDNGTETTDANSLKSFDSNGITVGSGSTFAPYSNGNNVAFWNWRINGGTTTTDNNGSVTSTIQTNSKVGISIATFTVATQGNFSFGHGLGSVPEMFWWKSRTTTQNWIGYHFTKTPSVPNQNGFYLNSTLAGFTTGGNWITELSSTRVAITDGQVSSGSNRDDVVYSFKSVEGFSKIGSYTGNGQTDGAFVYTGFRPAFVLGKSITSGGDNWFVFDNKRDVDNVVGADLNPDAVSVEATSSYMDFLSNGFKLRSTSGLVNDATTFIYMAFAEQPFKFSNAR